MGEKDSQENVWRVEQLSSLEIVEEYLKRFGVDGWKRQDCDRDQWKEFVKQTSILHELESQQAESNKSVRGRVKMFKLDCSNAANNRLQTIIFNVYGLAMSLYIKSYLVDPLDCAKQKMNIHI